MKKLEAASMQEESANLESCDLFFFFLFSDAQGAWLIWKLPELEAVDLRLQQRLYSPFCPPSDQSQANFVINLKQDRSKKQINT